MDKITITKELEINTHDAVEWLQSDIDAGFQSWIQQDGLSQELDSETQYDVYKLLITRLIKELSRQVDYNPKDSSDLMTKDDLVRFNESVRAYTKEAKEKANAKVRT